MSNGFILRYSIFLCNSKSVRVCFVLTVHCTGYSDLNVNVCNDVICCHENPNPISLTIFNNFSLHTFTLQEKNFLRREGNIKKKRL